jgi:prophage DNA circulation protein
MANFDNQTSTRLQLTDLRNEVRKFFESESVNVPKLLEITTRRKPLTILTYSFYGNVDKVSDLDALNDFDNPSFVEGNVTILTSNDG